MERVTEDRTVKRISWKVPGYNKKKGRPRKRWRGAVLDDMRDKRIPDWRRKAMDRGGRKRIITLLRPKRPVSKLSIIIIITSSYL